MTRPPNVVLDPSFPAHPKCAEVGPAARDLYVCGLCYSAQFLTDGFIPYDAVRTLSPGLARPGREAKALVEARLWEVVMDGYLVHDFADWQSTRADVEARRASARERQRRRRVSRVNHATVTRDASLSIRARESLDRDSDSRRFTKGQLSEEDARAREGLSMDHDLNSGPRMMEPDDRVPDGSALASSPAFRPPDVLSEGVAAVLDRVRDGDDRTVLVLDSLRRRGLPPAAFFSALESLERARPVRSEVAYVVGALQTMLREGHYSSR